MIARLKRVLLAAVLLCASPAFAVTASLTGYVGVTNGIDPRTPQTFSTPAGETGTINIAVKNMDGSAYDLTGAQQLLLTVRDRNNTIIISRQATFNSPSTLGTAFFPLVVADTVGLSAFGAVGYSYDVWVTDASGNRWAAVTSSTFAVTRAHGQPNQPVTVPATQTPLAQGTPGLRWRGSWSSLVAYAVNDAVQYLDVNGGLPALLSSFVCLVANTNVPPLNGAGALSSSWSYLSQRGANGAGDGGAYSPANPAQWSPVPTTQQNAINQLATQLSLHVLDGAAIPVAGTYLWANPQPATTAAQLDRLASLVYSLVLDTTPIPAAGSFSWAAPTPILIADQISRLAYVAYVYLLSGTPIP